MSADELDSLVALLHEAGNALSAAEARVIEVEARAVKAEEQAALAERALAALMIRVSEQQVRTAVR